MGRSGWQQCSPNTMLRIRAVQHFFARICCKWLWPINSPRQSRWQKKRLSWSLTPPPLSLWNTASVSPWVQVCSRPVPVAVNYIKSYRTSSPSGILPWRSALKWWTLTLQLHLGSKMSPVVNCSLTKKRKYSNWTTSVDWGEADWWYETLAFRGAALIWCAYLCFIGRCNDTRKRR